MRLQTWLTRRLQASKIFRVLASIVLVLSGFAAASPAALAQIQPRHTDPGWQAWYWNNMTLSGAPTVQRQDADLNFDWGTGSPDPSIPADRFSARWQRYIDLTPGNYRFTASSDDGIRVWIDGEMIIDLWYEHALLTRSADRTLAAGHHLVQVDYFESAGAASASVSWTWLDQPPPPTPTPTPAPITGWRGEYFNNMSISGAPALVRNDAEINFVWGTNSPAPGQVQADNFSVRWTRNLSLPGGNYRFTLAVDDGARLFVNGHTLIDAWRDQSERSYSGDIYLPASSVTVQLEYYENTGAASARLSWERLQPGTPPPTQPPPPPSGRAVIVDDRDANFARGGDASSWRFEAEGYNGSLTWSKNNDKVRPNYNWGRWYPALQRGRYEVFVYIPERFSTSAYVIYWVSHADGFSKRIVDQSRYSNQWVSLGAYNFRGNNQDYLSMADVTYEPRLSRLIAWDAVKWEPR